MEKDRTLIITDYEQVSIYTDRMTACFDAVKTYFFCEGRIQGIAVKHCQYMIIVL